MKKIIYLLLVFFSSVCHAQNLRDSSQKFPNQASLLLFTCGYRMPVNKNIIINSGHGLYFEAGINPGYFFSKKILVGFYGGWGWNDGLWYTTFNTNFLNDFNTSLSDKPFQGTDSAVISSLKKLFGVSRGRAITLPGCQTNSFHTHSLYYGIIIRLPIKYEASLKAYMGLTGTSYQGYNVATRGEYNYYEIRRAMYGIALIIFNGKRGRQGELFNTPLNTHWGVLSLYYENCNFSGSSLYFDDGKTETKIAFSNFVSPAFLQKYKNENVFGFKVAFSIM